MSGDIPLLYLVMKIFLIYLLLLMSAVACSEVDSVIDDEDDKGAEVVKPDDALDDAPDDETGDETVMIYGVKVYDESGDNAGGVAHYVYDYDDSGRVTTIVDAVSDEMIMQYRYEDNLVRVGGIIGEYIVELDDKGRIHETSVAGEDMTLKWSYGMNGYVNGVTASPETWSCRIVNRMGNFTEVPSLGDEELTYISYTDHLSRYSIDLWNNPVFGFNENILCYTFGVRAKGVISRNLPSSYKYYGDEWRFSYTFDDEGNVSVMEMSCNDELVRTVYFDCGDGFPDDMPEQGDDDEGTSGKKQKLVKTLMMDYYWEQRGMMKVGFEYDSQDRMTETIVKYDYDEADESYFECYYFQYDDSINEMTVVFDEYAEYGEHDTSKIQCCVFDDSALLKEAYFGSNSNVYNTFQYKNNKIYKIIEYDYFLSFENDWSLTLEMEFSWVNGNLAGYVYTKVWIGETEQIDYTDVEYEEQENICNIDLYYFSEGSACKHVGNYFSTFDRALFKEFFDKNLVKRAGDSFYDYEFDEDGYPVKMIVYEDGELYEEMIIEYYE